MAAGRAPLGRRRGAPRGPAFSLIEMLVALAILAAAFAIVGSAFMGTINAWRHGSAMLESLHHGEYVMDQLVSALRSAVYFSSSPARYGFRLEHRASQGAPDDVLSWVTSGTAFIPPGSPLEFSLHRLEITVEEDAKGHPAVAVRAYPYLSETDPKDIEPWFVSSQIRGLECRVYDNDKEEWQDKWESTNSIPERLELTLYLDREDPSGEPFTLKRLVEMPLAAAAKRVMVVGGSTNVTSGVTNRIRSPAMPNITPPAGMPRIRINPTPGSPNRPVRP